MTTDQAQQPQQPSPGAVLWALAMRAARHASRQDGEAYAVWIDMKEGFKVSPVTHAPLGFIVNVVSEIKEGGK